MRHPSVIASLVLMFSIAFFGPDNLNAQNASPVNYKPYSAETKSQNNSVFWYKGATTNVVNRSTKTGVGAIKALKSKNTIQSVSLEKNGSTDSLTNWPKRSLGEISINPFLSVGEMPDDRSDQLLNGYVRDWRFHDHCDKVLMWSAPNVRYQPLFFEDVALERYGNVFRNDYLQTAVSAVHFFSSASLWPLHALHDPAFSCDYPLGYCRPGNCTNRIFQRQFWGVRR